MKKTLNLITALLLITAMVLPAFAISVSSVRQNGAPVVDVVVKETNKKDPANQETVKPEDITVVVTPLVEQEKASWATQQEIKAATESLNEGDLTQVQAVQEAVKALNALNAALKPGASIIKPGTIVKPVIPEAKPAVPAVKPATPAETVPGETIPAETMPAETAPAQYTEVKAEDLIVSEVFHVDASHTDVAITFEADGIRAGQFLMVMVFVDGQWQVLDFNDVEIVEDGKVRITFRQFGTVAFVVDKNEVEQYMAEDAEKAKLEKQNNGNKNHPNNNNKPNNNSGNKNNPGKK